MDFNNFVVAQYSKLVAAEFFKNLKTVPVDMTGSVEQIFQRITKVPLKGAHWAHDILDHTVGDEVIPPSSWGELLASANRLSRNDPGLNKTQLIQLLRYSEENDFYEIFWGLSPGETKALEELIFEKYLEYFRYWEHHPYLEEVRKLTPF